MRHERFSPGDGNAGAEGRPSNAIAKSIETTRPDLDLQATLDRAIRHQWRAEWLGSILAMRLDQRRLLVLGAGTLHGLEPELAEDLAETFLHDLQFPAAAEREAERQRRQWSQWCARTWRARP